MPTESLPLLRVRMLLIDFSWRARQGFRLRLHTRPRPMEVTMRKLSVAMMGLLRLPPRMIWPARRRGRADLAVRRRRRSALPRGACERIGAGRDLGLSADAMMMGGRYTGLLNR